MKKILTSIFALILSFGVFAQQTKDESKYRYSDGIYFEICQDTNNRYCPTENNVIYQAGNVYYFSYRYIDKYGKEYRYIVHSLDEWIFVGDESKRGQRLEFVADEWKLIQGEWIFVPIDSLSDSIVEFVRMEIKPTDIDGIYDPDYGQTIIEYTYLMKNGMAIPSWEYTGLVENDKNIWMHPPRSELFRILQLNPFPFIKEPFVKGNKWIWELRVGLGPSNERWKKWEGVITINHYSYEITDTAKIIATSIGDLSCYVIESVAKSELGDTFLTAYFNTNYGFVKLDYTNIDGSKLILKLEKIEKKRND
jgi:hypothetical protein